ncbi:MAG: bifunctional oligoribonuclease/PAP phosphatase NrnA [Treponema sp.]|jgi:phosphoesterase RecJ-like protein|nr:bifunctional oligoribonuclease/PAP phosphatase NrnA [Treponema sp.]
MQKILNFINKYDSFILCTHEIPDADGIGAEMLLAFILKKLGKNVKAINAKPIPANFSFMDPEHLIEAWNPEQHQSLVKTSTLIILDTSDEYNIGKIKDEVLPHVLDVIVVDHHELGPKSVLTGYVDPTAASSSEMIMMVAEALHITPDLVTANAVFAGISYDTGSFAYIKTNINTFKAALALVGCGVNTYTSYQNLYESASTGAVILQKIVLSTLEMHDEGRIAVQILRKEDLKATGTALEDAEGFINLPLRSKDVKISIIIKESGEGPIRCSLRSKGDVNVSKIAQQFSGGGHATAAGFKSTLSIEQTLETLLNKVKQFLRN